MTTVEACSESPVFPSKWRSHNMGGLMAMVGPLLTRREDSGWAYAILIREDHLNPAGVAHGGTLTALVDHALSTIAWDASGRVPCVTVQLDNLFFQPCHLGQLLVARGHITRATGSLVFLSGTLHADEEIIGTSQAVMKRLR